MSPAAATCRCLSPVLQPVVGRLLSAGSQCYSRHYPRVAALYRLCCRPRCRRLSPVLQPVVIRLLSSGSRRYSRRYPRLAGLCRRLSPVLRPVVSRLLSSGSRSYYRRCLRLDALCRLCCHRLSPLASSTTACRRLPRQSPVTPPATSCRCRLSSGSRRYSHRCPRLAGLCRRLAPITCVAVCRPVLLPVAGRLCCRLLPPGSHSCFRH